MKASRELISWNIQLIDGITVARWNRNIDVSCLKRWSFMASLQLHCSRCAVIHVVFVHVMMRQVTIGQPDTCITSRVTHVNDLKLISRVREALIHTSKMAYNVIPVGYNILQSMVETRVVWIVSV